MQCPPSGPFKAVSLRHTEGLRAAPDVGWGRHLIPNSESQRLTLWPPTLETTVTECHQWSDVGLPLYKHHLIYPLSFKVSTRRGGDSNPILSESVCAFIH